MIAHGVDTPEYFKRFTTEPNDKSNLENERNKRRLKYVMMGAKIWNSFTSDFQIGPIGSKHEFNQSGEYNGSLLLDFVRRSINPFTTVGESKLKDDIEG